MENSTPDGHQRQFLSRLRETTAQISPEEFLRHFPEHFIQYCDDAGKDGTKALSTPHFDPTEAARRQQEGCGVFFSPNAFKGARRIESLVGIQAMYVDIDCAKEGDGQSVEEIDKKKNAAATRLLGHGIDPHAVVETKNGLQSIWLFTRCTGEKSLQLFREAMEAAIRAFGGDPGAKDPTRVLRLPGFLHLKDPAHPFPCRLLVNNLGKSPYDLAELRTCLMAIEVFHGTPETEIAKEMSLHRRKWQEGLQGVPQGGRNDTAASVVGRILAGLPKELWETAGWGGFREWNTRNMPPLPEQELKSVFESIQRREMRTHMGHGRDGSEETPNKGTKQSDRVIALLSVENCVLFHTDLDEPFARIKVYDHWETWRVGGQKFGRWLKGKYWKEHNEAVNDTAFASALSVIECRANFEGQMLHLWNRVAWQKDAIFYDLCDDAWRAVRIAADGWGIVEQPPILFRRYGHEHPQVEPTPSGNLRDILRFTNLRKDQEILFLVYIVSCFIPGIPHPILTLFGDQGSTKTTHSRLVRNIIDPAKPLVTGLPANKQELEQQLAHNWVPSYDNVSHVSDEFSDAFCRASTGDGGSKRQLYTDMDDVRWEYQPCVVFNGINICARNPDMLERAFLLELQRLPKGSYKPERKLWSEFNAALPGILGGVFDALSHALYIHPTLDERALPRMADFTQWGRAIAEGLGYSQKEFLEAFGANVRKQNQEAIDASEVATTVVSFMDGKQEWKGSPSALLKELEVVAERENISTSDKAWPKKPNVLTRRVNEVKTNLEEDGIVVGQWREGRQRWISLMRTSSETVTTVTPSQGASRSPEIGDDTSESSATDQREPSLNKPYAEAKSDDSDGNDDVARMRLTSPDLPF